MFRLKMLSVAICGSALLLTACNSNDDDNIALPSKAVTPIATTTITVTPSLGKILNGRIALKNAKTGATLAPTQTITPSNNGTATFTVPVSTLADPILAEVLPTTAGKVEYFDEALEQNKTITVAAADIAKPILRAAASVTANANIGVTGLTEAAVQRALKLANTTTLTAQQINAANADVENALRLNSKFNIIQPPIVIGNGDFEKLVNAALDAQRRAYATYLATLAKEAQRINAASATPAYDMAKAFANDFAHDGKFDAVGSQALAINYSNAFLTNWFNWVQNFYSQFLALNSLSAFNNWFTGFDITKPNGGTPTPAVPIRTVDGVEEYACSAEGNVKSTLSNQSIQINFINQRATTIQRFWLEANGTRRTYSSVTASNNLDQQTFVTHPWLITDNTGACIGIYKPITASKKTITFKASEVMIGNPNNEQPNTNTCSSEGTSKKLGFANAPSDFCSFTQETSATSSIPNLARELYVFDSANGETVTITVGQNTLISVSVQKGDKYAYACGVEGTVACQNTVFSNQTSYKEFSFANTVLQGIIGTTQNLTLKNGSLVHQVATSTSHINLSACTLTQGTEGVFCGAQVVSDFSLNLRNSLNSNACFVSKVGEVVNISSGNLVVKAKLNNEEEDVATSTNQASGIVVSEMVNNQKQTIALNYDGNGNLTSATAEGTGVTGLFCNAVLD